MSAYIQQYERRQHAQALRLASDMFKTGIDAAWKHGSLTEHGLAAGTGGPLLIKVTAICSRMENGQYSRKDRVALAKYMSALEVWVRDNAANTYDVSIEGDSRGPWKIVALSAETALENAKKLLALMGIKHGELKAVEVAG